MRDLSCVDQSGLRFALSELRLLPANGVTVPTVDAQRFASTQDEEDHSERVSEELIGQRSHFKKSSSDRTIPSPPRIRCRSAMSNAGQEAGKIPSSV
jgi:hypothetical protein